MLLGIHHNEHAEYAALFLVAMGCYSAMPVVVCWFTMNLGGHHRRAVGTAWQIGFGNVGGIIAVYAFIMSDAPYYRKGYGIGLGFIVLSIISCTIYFFSVLAQNRSREKQPRPVHDWAQREREKEQGDMAVGYRYWL